MPVNTNELIRNAPQHQTRAFQAPDDSTDIAINATAQVKTQPLFNHGAQSIRVITTGSAVDVTVTLEFADQPINGAAPADADFLIDTDTDGTNITAGVITLASAITVRINLTNMPTPPERFIRCNIEGQGGNGADTVVAIRQSAQNV